MIQRRVVKHSLTRIVAIKHVTRDEWAARDWQQLPHFRVFLLFSLVSLILRPSVSSFRPFHRFHSRRWGYCAYRISSFKSGISRAWNSNVDARAKRRFDLFFLFFFSVLPLFHLSAPSFDTPLSFVVSDYCFRYDLYFLLSRIDYRTGHELKWTN